MGLGFSFYFSLLIFSKTTLPICKKAVPMESPPAHSLVCVHNSLVSFYLTPLSTAFEKVCGMNFWPNFLYFSHFIKNSLKSEILGSTDRKYCEKLPCINGSAYFYLHKKLWSSEKSKWNFLTFPKNYSLKSEILVLIERNSSEKLPCITGYAQNLSHEK